MTSSSQTPAQPQAASGNASPDKDADAKYAGQADAGDTSFAGGNAQADQQSAAPKTVDVPQTANPPGTKPQPGTGLDSPGTDDADQADAGDTSLDPGKS